MRIAYLSTDEVNVHLAGAMAAACGLTLCPLAPKDPPPEEFDALLCDGDSWPVGQQPEELAELHAGAVAVHGYHLEGGQAESLCRHGVAVYRRLQPKVFRFLRRAVHSVHAATARGRNPQERQATFQAGGVS
jgi:hypothetical protein